MEPNIKTLLPTCLKIIAMHSLRWDHEYFIPTKCHQNPSSGSGEEVENVKVYRQMTDGAL